MLKNPTPRHIALLSSLIIFSVGTVLVVLTELTHWGELNWLKYVLVSGVFLVVSYSVLIYYLRSYIYRKIKLIYKTIHNEKLPPEEKERQKKININSNVMDEVDQEVAAWAENQQREIDKYKSWAEYRRNFLGDISHELKTPIFNIQGYLESLLDGGLQDESVNLIFLQKAVKNVERLQIIIHDLETISRLESGEMLLEMQSFDIRELAKEVFEEIEIKAAERNITLDLKDGASHPFRVKADREKIRQVLINLVHNSVKYGVPNGRTKIAFYDMDKHVLIEVADNGIGIPRQHLTHVFDRFYRVDKSRSRAQGGSGLGLSIVKHTIEAHKQTINVRSSPSLGSTFGFTLDKA
jgi:two-component system phosphate regulon sensor histidine kinase PhoR